MKNTKLNILVLEDNKNDMDLIKSHIKNKIDTLNPTYVKSAEGAQNAFRRNLFHLISLDQRIPKTDSPEPYIDNDDNFIPVITAYEAHQPISTGVVFTGYGSISRAIDSNKHGLEYLQKSATGLSDWRARISDIQRRYFDAVLVDRGACRLPSPLSISIKNLRDQEQYRIKLMAVRDLFEIATQLFVGVIGAVALKDIDLAPLVQSILNNLYQSDRGNAAWKECFKLLLKILDNGKSDITRQVRMEIQRFFFGGSGPLTEALDGLHSLRNELAHDRLKKSETYKTIYETCHPYVHCLLESFFFFALHPIFDNLDIRRTSGDLFSYTAEDLRGDSLLPPKIQVGSRNRLETSGPVWCFMKDSSNVQNAFPLFPLLITHTDPISQHKGLYILFNLNKGEYRELSTGRSLELPRERMGELRRILGK